MADIFEPAVAQRTGSAPPIGRAGTVGRRGAGTGRQDVEPCATSLRESKRLLNRPLEAELEQAFQNEIEAIMRCFGTLMLMRPPWLSAKNVRLSLKGSDILSLCNIMTT